MFALTLGNLELSNASAAILSLVSLLFLVSFIFVSVKNDNEGLMKWMFTDPNHQETTRSSVLLMAAISFWVLPPSPLSFGFNDSALIEDVSIGFLFR